MRRIEEASVSANDPFGLSRLDDPKFEAIERAKLIPVGDVPSKEMQSAFYDFVVGEVSGIKVPLGFRVLPSRLFYALKCRFDQFAGLYSASWARYYYKEPDKNGFSDSSLSKALNIFVEGQSIASASIALSSEQSSGAESTLNPKNGSEGMWVGFHDQNRGEDMSMNFGVFQVSSYIQGEKLQVSYVNGKIGFIIFSSDQRRNVALTIIDGCEITYGDTISLEKLSSYGKQTLDLADGHYDVEIDSEGQDGETADAGCRNVILKRTIKGKVLDLIRIPLEAHAGDIFKSIIPAELLANPYQCGLKDEDAARGEDLKYDDGWKNVNLATFDIAWKRRPRE